MSNELGEHQIIDAEAENLSHGIVGRASELTAAEEELLGNPLLFAGKLKARMQEVEDLLNVRRKAALEQFERDNGAAIEALEGMQKDYHHAVELAREKGQTQEGRYHLVNKARQTRTVNVERFRQAFPEVFLQVAQVPVTKAEAILGKVQLQPLCDVSVGADAWEVEVKIKKVQV